MGKAQKENSVSLEKMQQLEKAFVLKREDAVRDLVKLVKKQVKDKKAKAIIKAIESSGKKLSLLRKEISQAEEAEARRLAKEEKKAARLARKKEKEEARKAAAEAKKAKKAAEKKEKKAAKKKAAIATKSEEKKAAKSKKTEKAKPVEKKAAAPKLTEKAKPAPKRTTAAKTTRPAAKGSSPAADGSSAALNARMAIAALANITTVADLDKFLAGETRATVLRRGNSRKNALQAS